MVLTIFLSLWDMMMWTFLHFIFSYWLEMAYKTCCTFVGYFLTMLRIQKLFLSLAGMVWFHGILIFDWEIYDMLWWTQYFSTITNRSTSWWEINIDFKYIIFDGGMIWYVNYNFLRVEVFVPIKSSEPGDHPLPNLLVSLSNFADKQYLSFLVWKPPFHCISAVFITH